jgi:hypothetical protein
MSAVALHLSDTFLVFLRRDHTLREPSPRRRNKQGAGESCPTKISVTCTPLHIEEAVAGQMFGEQDSVTCLTRLPSSRIA